MWWLCMFMIFFFAICGYGSESKTEQLLFMVMFTLWAVIAVLLSIDDKLKALREKGAINAKKEESRG